MASVNSAHAVSDSQLFCRYMMKKLEIAQRDGVLHTLMHVEERSLRNYTTGIINES